MSPAFKFGPTARVVAIRSAGEVSIMLSAGRSALLVNAALSTAASLNRELDQAAPIQHGETRRPQFARSHVWPDYRALLARVTRGQQTPSDVEALRHLLAYLGVKT